MKLSEKLKEKLKKDFHYSDLTDKDWDSEWVLDNKWKPYYKEKKFQMQALFYFFYFTFCLTFNLKKR